jgi:hypothetical protein
VWGNQTQDRNATTTACTMNKKNQSFFLMDCMLKKLLGIWMRKGRRGGGREAGVREAGLSH